VDGLKPWPEAEFAQPEGRTANRSGPGVKPAECFSPPP
jgi:hypothetical protein